jgi:hypothetical protein
MGKNKPQKFGFILFDKMNILEEFEVIYQTRERVLYPKYKHREADKFKAGESWPNFITYPNLLHGSDFLCFFPS